MIDLIRNREERRSRSGRICFCTSLQEATEHWPLHRLRVGHSHQITIRTLHGKEERNSHEIKTIHQPPPASGKKIGSKCSRSSGMSGLQGLHQGAGFMKIKKNPTHRSTKSCRGYLKAMLTCDYFLTAVPLQYYVWHFPVTPFFFPSNGTYSELLFRKDTRRLHSWQSLLNPSSSLNAGPCKMEAALDYVLNPTWILQKCSKILSFHEFGMKKFCSEDTTNDGFLERWAGKQILFQQAVHHIWTE